MRLYDKLNSRINQTSSRVCIGLDTDINLIPPFFKKDLSGVYEFNKAIIESTQNIALAYKINTAFYEAYGSEGWACLKDTFKLIPPEIVSIADAKRGDIGNTSERYAVSIFDDLNADTITLSPYMGFDSIEPFLKRSDKGSIILTLTSNAGAKDFQYLKSDGLYLFEHVAKKMQEWHYQYANLLLVVGATHGAEIAAIRALAPDLFFLVPGIGAQGGNINDVVKYAGNKVIINSSRNIIYADSTENFALTANKRALELHSEINFALSL